MVVLSSDASPGATVQFERPTKRVVDDIWLYKGPNGQQCAIVTMPDGTRYNYKFQPDGSFQKELFV